jgi:hypothetical protein
MLADDLKLGALLKDGAFKFFRITAVKVLHEVAFYAHNMMVVSRIRHFIVNVIVPQVNFSNYTFFCERLNDTVNRHSIRDPILEHVSDFPNASRAVQSPKLSQYRETGFCYFHALIEEDPTSMFV